MSQEDQEKKIRPGILDTVSLSKQSQTLRTFNPQGAATEYLEKLLPRERQVLVSRYGLFEGQPLTLENIGKKLNLTRERVRQIEKEGLKKLNSMSRPANFSTGVDLISQIIEEHGNVIREDRIIDIVLPSGDGAVNRSAIFFILHLIPRFHLLKETAKNYRAWYVASFDTQIFDLAVNLAKSALQSEGKPQGRQDLMEKIQSHESAPAELKSLSAEAIESFLFISKEMDKNPFSEWGLADWPQIHPKDVGDKAHLVLLHHGRPEHYARITEMINKDKFDDRTAQKETVHNELIKDKRFVLVGRGIYALSSWGYKPGVVADIIEEILKKAERPLSRDEIVKGVLEQRLVKKNTIIVGLSDRERFQKTADNKYTLPKLAADV